MMIPKSFNQQLNENYSFKDSKSKVILRIEQLLLAKLLQTVICQNICKGYFDYHQVQRYHSFYYINRLQEPEKMIRTFGPQYYYYNIFYYDKFRNRRTHPRQENVIFEKKDIFLDIN
ncbi:hypothetical protein pb186bvf_013678, partial [Paramecium bursaria]